jgi:hypothetical protein
VIQISQMEPTTTTSIGSSVNTSKNNLHSNNCLEEAHTKIPTTNIEKVVTSRGITKDKGSTIESKKNDVPSIQYR